jgi:hypothetical protein
VHNLERRAVPAGPPAPPGSLAAALAQVPDPRRPYGWRPPHPPLPLVGLLQLTVAALVCGARSLYAIAQWGQERLEDEPELLVQLGLPPGRRPCVATLHRMFKALDVAAFEAAVGTWLAQTGLGPDEALALDGKSLRGIHGEQIPGVHLVAAYSHQAGAVLAQLRSAGKGQELAAAQTLVQQVPLAGRVVTGDALLTQRGLCQAIVAGGGDYLLPVDSNQPTLREDVATAFSPLDRDGAGRAGPAAAAPLAPERSAGPGRAVERGHEAGAQGGPRAAGSPDALDGG